MKFKQYNTINNFWTRYGELIKKYELENTLMAGNCINMLKEEQEDAFYASIDDNKGNTLLALMVPPYPIVLFATGEVDEKAFDLLSDSLMTLNISFTSVVAPNHLAEQFVHKLQEKEFYQVKELTKMQFFRLEKVTNIKRSKGKLRLAERKDLSFLKTWVPDAVIEMLGDEIDGEKKALSMIEEERLFLWIDENDIPVSMVAKTRPTFSDITLAMVYTPKVYRKQGYASASVAALSQMLLDEGYRYCTLFTDLANPTSNKIYKEIGYEAILDYYEYDVENIVTK
ncbi:hypothetical protein CIB95_12365 [Lottiidibacillus patelloidae]|uniref:N-acetyltransferase domain-containing protein n=1 Tax=Lottiidibacillus patelloidae TaxID=2670334 RepID=A0A263BRA0_9BACI|nr:GNAT family N-acetyltransferase [Lottiidibacillus patelloidae]OZM56214.1 hypothetical protein CIB95_12365 [Lottiidibacillus patelloidae]